MTTVINPLVNTDKLYQYSLFLRNDAKKIIDALFVENLIAAIDKHPGADKSCIDRWLRAAFEFKQNYEDNNCIDIYNMSFYHQILEKIS